MFTKDVNNFVNLQTCYSPFNRLFFLKMHEYDLTDVNYKYIYIKTIHVEYCIQHIYVLITKLCFECCGSTRRNNKSATQGLIYYMTFPKQKLKC